MKTAFIVIAACAVAAPALAQEPVGCDKFKWPLDKERATLNGTDLPKIVSGGQRDVSDPLRHDRRAVAVRRRKTADAAGARAEIARQLRRLFEAKAPKQAGSYKITLSAEGWIDVTQSGNAVKSTAFSGALGCEGVRKSVKFDLAAAPFTVELCGVKADAIKIVIEEIEARKDG